MMLVQARSAVCGAQASRHALGFRGLVLNPLAVFSLLASALSVFSLIVCPRLCVAAEVTQRAFVYDGGEPQIVDDHAPLRPIQANWNPRFSQGVVQVREPGFHVAFFGSGLGCEAGASNGPVAGISANLAAQVVNLTGLSVDYGNSKSWTPGPNQRICPSTDISALGPAFVVAQSKPANGLALFTYVGDGRDLGLRPFWKQFSDAGQYGLGQNRSIEGTFATWIFDWKKNLAVSPWWDDTTAKNDNAKVTVTSVQSVSTAVLRKSIDNSSQGQVKQQYAVTFLNRDCIAKKVQGSPCQVRYMFQTAISRSDALPLARFERAILIIDPAQNNLPVIAGTLKSDGEATDAGLKSDDLWISRGSSSTTSVFRNRTFAAEITFRQFVNGLRLVAARQYSLQVTQVTKDDIAKLFGAAWNRPETWVISDVNIGQEVRCDDSEHYIGGSLTRMMIVAARR